MQFDSLKHVALQFVLQAVVWIVPVLIATHVEWSTITVSGVLSALAFWAHSQLSA